MAEIEIQMDNVDVEISASEYLPYSPIEHYYNPVPDRNKIYNPMVKDRKLLPDSVMFNPQTLEYCNKMIAVSHVHKELPDYWDIDKLGLGLGYGEVEGHTLVSMIHIEQPTGILEIGCGHSSEYARLGYKSLPHPVKHICVEPYASDTFKAYCAVHNIELVEQAAQDVDFESIIKSLGSRPMFFVDTTHVLRADGELHHILINLLPKIPADALLHFHDIFLPWPILNLQGSGDAKSPHFSFAWNETLVLAILLANSDNFTIVHPGYFLAVEKQELYGQVVPRYLETGQIGSSLWVKKVG